MNDASNPELFRWIVRSTTDGLWIFDDSGTTTFANVRLAEILGRTAGEMVDLPVSETLDAAGRHQFLDHLKALEGTHGGLENQDCSLIRKDGSRIWALVSHSPLLDDEGVRRGWLHRVTELTDRKLLQDKLVTSQQQLAEAQSIAKVGSWEWDVTNNVVAWSDELFRIYELQPQEFAATYEAFLGYVHPEDRPMVEAAVNTAFAEADTFEFDARIIKQGGDEGWIRGRGRVTRDEQGAPVRMGGTAHEITESVLVAQELAATRDAAMEASRMKSDFLATMSHEIRTPLNGVIGLAELLMRTGLAPAQRELATGISQAGGTLLGLINDILDLSKIESGKLELEHVDFEVRGVVEQVVSLMAEEGRAKGVALDVTCHAEVPHQLRGDPVRFGQVITNLVSNAVKFTSDGSVAVTVSPEPRRSGSPALRVVVSDTGVGIPPEAQPDLFEAFTQADTSTTREFGGTGLGLTISRRLVEALGGQIGFSSEVGVGSSFWFTATFADPAPEVTGAPGADAPPVEHEPAVQSCLGTVLVAEDNAVNQMVARGMLEGLGYAVVFAQDGVEAVAAANGTPDRFVAVLMDCRMPRLDGYAATRAIREQERPGARIPIIAMTASAVVGERERCLAAGMDDFLAKPVSFELLESTLARWIEGAPTPEVPLAGVDEDGVLDLGRIQMLKDLRPGDHSLFEQFVGTFLSRVPTDLEAIEEAVRCRDHTRLVEAAHQLKGSAQNLGAAEVGRVCQELESAGGREDLGTAEALIPELGQQVERAAYALRAMVSDGSAMPSIS